MMTTLLIGCALATTIGQTTPTKLPDQSKLKADFNRDKGKVRVVMIVSPVCGMCVDGAKVIRDDVVVKLKGKPLNTYSVFIPMVKGDGIVPAEKSATDLAKHGVKSYWDGEKKLGNAYAKLYGNPGGLETAWDVYFIYGPNAVWGKTPPKPDYYMHQLSGGDQSLCLDGPKFRKAVEQQLKKVESISLKSNGKRLVLLGDKGCPNTPKMKAQLDAALAKLHWTGGYESIDVWKLPESDYRRGYGAPTLLLDGKDLFGQPAPATGGSPGCRLYPGGVPTASQLIAKLKPSTK